MSDSMTDALRNLEIALRKAYLEPNDDSALELQKQILDHKKTAGCIWTPKHTRLSQLSAQRVGQWRLKHVAPPIPGDTKGIKIAENPEMVADLALVLDMDLSFTADGDSVPMSMNGGTLMANVFYLYKIPLNKRQSEEITAALKLSGIKSPTTVCNSLTTRLEDRLTLLECLKARALLPPSLLPLCATIAQINDTTTTCRTVYAINPTLEDTGVKLTCERHCETTYDDSTTVLVKTKFALLLAHLSKNSSDEANFYDLMENMQLLPSVDVMATMIRDKSIYLTTHFNPVVPWLKRAIELWARNKKTAFVTSFLGHVTNTGVGSICAHYRFVQTNFMGAIVDATKEHNGDGIKMMCAIIKMMDKRLNPGDYRVVEVLDSNGEVKPKYVNSLVKAASDLSGVTNKFVPGSELGHDSVKLPCRRGRDAGSVLASVVCGPMQPNLQTKGLSATTFGGLVRFIPGLPKTGIVNIDDVIKFFQQNPDATARVCLGPNRYLAGVGEVVGAKSKIFKFDHLIKYFNNENLCAQLGITRGSLWYDLYMITRVLCNGKLNYVFTPKGIHPTGPIPNVMLTEYLCDDMQTEFGPAISALSGLKMSTEHVDDPVIGYSIQTDTTPLEPGQKREWFKAHSVPTIEITLDGITCVYQISPPQ